MSLMFHSDRVINFRGQATWKMDFELIKKILYIGVPNGLENSLFQLGKILLLCLISTFGTYAIAANAVCNTLASFNVLPGQAINLALLSVASVCIGAGDYNQKAHVDHYRMYSDNIGNHVCLCPLDHENLSINTSDRKACSAGDPMAHGAGRYLLGAFLYAAEYFAGSRRCGLDHVYCHCIHVVLPNRFCLSAQPSFSGRSDGGVDCNDHRLGISGALLHGSISWKQMGAFHESFRSVDLESVSGQESFDKHSACLYNGIL